MKCVEGFYSLAKRFKSKLVGGVYTGRRRKRSIDYFESKKNASVGSGCKDFIEKANKLTSLLGSYNRDGIKDLEEFTSIATYIMNATELHGRIIDSECNKTELKELRDVHSKI